MYIHTIHRAQMWAIFCDQSPRCMRQTSFLFSPWPSFFKELSFLTSYKIINLCMYTYKRTLLLFRYEAHALNQNTHRITLIYRVSVWSSSCVQQQSTPKCFQTIKYKFLFMSFLLGVGFGGFLEETEWVNFKIPFIIGRTLLRCW